MALIAWRAPAWLPTSDVVFRSGTGARVDAAAWILSSPEVDAFARNCRDAEDVRTTTDERSRNAIAHRSCAMGLTYENCFGRLNLCAYFIQYHGANGSLLG